MRDAEHPSEAVRHAFADGSLPAAERAEVARHLRACRGCARDVESLAAVRLALAIESERAGASDVVFEARLRGALDREDTARIRRIGRARRVRWLSAASLAAAVLLGALWLAGGRDPSARDLVAAAFRDAALARAERMPIDRVTSDPAPLAAFQRERGITFATRVLDLGMMGWTLVGGGVGPFAERPSALSLYRDVRARWLLCRMFEATLAELPVPDERFDASGFTFHVHRRDGTTAVFWREGGVLCVLIADLPEADVRALAVAKAMAP